jgi:CBS domain-containing protein
MVKEDFLELVKEIKENDKEFKMTTREFLYSFGCEKRTSGNTARINNYLEENKLETSPDYINCWIDGEIVLKHKKKAKSKRDIDPIQRVKLLTAANRIPVSITKESTLKEAITLMMLNNFSQLPIMRDSRNVVGIISWESIGYALTNGCNSELVIDYIKKDFETIDYETPLLDAIRKIILNDFVLVKKENSVSGIVTLADISDQFISVTEPFLLLEQIENHIRLILDGKFLVEEMRSFCSDDGFDSQIEFIDDLTFGNYIRIIENPKNWDRLNLKIERSHFIKQLDKIREIRNDIMHFDPEGITKEQREDLIKMSNFLTELRRYL